MSECSVLHLIEQGEYDAALDLLETWPNSTSRTFYRATCHLSKPCPDYVLAESGFSSLLGLVDDLELQKLVRLRLAISFHGQNRLVQALLALVPLLKGYHSNGGTRLAYQNYGNLCFEMGLAHHWLACCRKAGDLFHDRPLDQQAAQFRYQRGLAYLMTGQFEKAWSDLEYRFQAGCAVEPSLALPRLRSLMVHDTGGRLLLYGDQGLGDILFSFRFVPLVRDLFRSISLICPPSLVAFSKVCGLFDDVFVVDQLDEELFDVWSPINSLPCLLDVSSISEVPLQQIQISNDSIPEWCQSLKVSSLSRPLVALNWHGGSDKESLFSAGIRERSFPFGEYEAVSALSDCSLLSVQVGHTARQAIDSHLSKHFLPQQYYFDQEPADFLLTASVLKQVDLLITNDTSVAHLGGVLGVPTWVVLKCHPYWQWGDTSEFNSWYPSVRCFRQKKPFEWGGAMENLDAALREHLLASVQTKFTPPVLDL